MEPSSFFSPATRGPKKLNGADVTTFLSGNCSSVPSHRGLRPRLEKGTTFPMSCSAGGLSPFLRLHYDYISLELPRRKPLRSLSLLTTFPKSARAEVLPILFPLAGYHHDYISHTPSRRRPPSFAFPLPPFPLTTFPMSPRAGGLSRRSPHQRRCGTRGSTGDAGNLSRLYVCLRQSGGEIVISADPPPLSHLPQDYISRQAAGAPQRSPSRALCASRSPRALPFPSPSSPLPPPLLAEASGERGSFQDGGLGKEARGARQLQRQGEVRAGGGARARGAGRRRRRRRPGLHPGTWTRPQALCGAGDRAGRARPFAGGGRLELGRGLCGAT